MALSVSKLTSVLGCQNYASMSSFLLLCFLKVEDVVVALDESLRPAASGIAMKLRSAGRRVELVLEAKKMKWAIKVGDYAELERAHTLPSRWRA